MVICLYFVLRNSTSNFIVKEKKKHILYPKIFLSLQGCVGYLLLYADLL